MKESLERQDSAAVFALLNQDERARAQMREHRAAVRCGFQEGQPTTSPSRARLK